MTLKEEWESWASTADRSTEGWEAAFPEWDRLVSAAGECMKDSHCSEHCLELIKECWLMCEEGEELIDYCKKHYSAVRSTVIKLAESKNPYIRWQIYAVLAEGGEEAKKTLLEGLNDPDAYARRRAIISLSEHDVQNIEAVADHLLNDPDPYIRQALVELVRDRADDTLKQKVFKALRSDPVQHVRAAVPPR